jgi:hypothetical protein
MRLLVGLIGHLGSGKDALADILVEQCGFIKRSIAEPLRCELAEILLRGRFLWPADIPDEIRYLLEQYERSIEAIWEKPTQPGMRRLLQWYGTQYRRSQDPDYWVRQAEKSLPDYGRYVYTDIRFPNEAVFIKQAKGKLWKIVRSSQPVDPFWSHETEQLAACSNCHELTIKNDGSIDDLKRTTILLFNDWYARAMKQMEQEQI